MNTLRITALLAMLVALPVYGTEPPVEPPDPPEHFRLNRQDLDPISGAMESQYCIENSNCYGYWARRSGRIRLLYCWEKHAGPTRYRRSSSYLAPVPESGEVLPIFGCLYRVAAGPQGKGFPSLMTFTKLAPAENREEFQVERAGTYIVPLQRHGYGETWSRFSADQGMVRLRCNSIEASPETSGEYHANLEVLVSTRKPNSRLSRSKTLHFSVRQGQTYRLNTGLNREQYHKFSVRRIVPRHEQWKTMGWVELNLAWRDVSHAGGKKLGIDESR